MYLNKIIVTCFIVLCTSKMANASLDRNAQLLLDFFNPVFILKYDESIVCRQFDEINNRLALYKDHCDEMQDALENLGGEALDSLLQSNADNAQSYIQTIDLLKDLYQRTKGSQLFYLEPFCGLLGGFLVTRFEFLKTRRDNKILFQSRAREAVYLQSTYPEYVAALDQEGLRAFELTCYYLIQDFYQRINYCILKLFHMMKTELWNEKNKAVLHTKKLLQFSVSLWSHLVNENFENVDDFGHLDQSIEEYQDLDLYRKFILREKDTTIVIKREFLDHPLFKPKEKDSIGFSEVSVNDESKTSELSEVSISKKKKKHKKKKPKPQILVAENTREDKDVESDIEINESEVTENGEIENDLSTKADEVVDGNLEESKDFVLLQQEDIAYGYQTYVKQYKKRDSPVLDEKVGCIFRLTGVHKSTFDQIMQIPFLGSLAYRSFENLWKHLGGVIRATSGSHRKLLCNDQCLGGTYEPHGGHGYGYRTVKYLKDAIVKLMDLKGFKI